MIAQNKPRWMMSVHEQFLHDHNLIVIKDTGIYQSNDLKFIKLNHTLEPKKTVYTLREWKQRNK